MQTAATGDDLKVGISNKQILKIALPISLAMLVPQINFVVNNVFLGKLGEKELAIAGITGVIYLVFALIGNGLNSGLQALISRRAGEGRPQEIGRLYAQSIWIALFFALAAIIIIYSAGGFFLKQTLYDPEVIRAADSFLKIRIWGIPFLYFFQMCNALLVGTSQSRYMKYGFWVQAGLNILFDYCFILGGFGTEAIGFNGAAVASLLSEIAGLAVVLGIIFYKKIQIRFSLFTHLRYNVKRAGLIFTQSLPLVGQWLISIVSWVVFYVLIEHYGQHSLAISNTMRNIFGLFGIFVWAFASTTNAMVSNIIGQGKSEKVIYLVKKVSLLSFGFTLVLCILVNIFPDLILSIYDRDENFVNDAIPVIRIVTSGMLVMSFATVWLNAVTGTGNTRINLAIEIIVITLYIFYIWLIMYRWKLSLTWAWSSELVYWAGLFTLSWIYMHSGRWKNKTI
jgi:multidrug resistance protein, MATE family